MTSGDGGASETFYATIVANTPEAIIVTTLRARLLISIAPPNGFWAIRPTR